MRRLFHAAIYQKKNTAPALYYGNETKVTRRDRDGRLRDETRDGPVKLVSRPKLPRRDEMQDQVHKKQNFTQNFDPNIDIFVYFSFETEIFLRDGLAR